MNACGICGPMDGLGEYAQGWWLILVKCDAENLIVVD